MGSTISHLFCCEKIKYMYFSFGYVCMIFAKNVKVNGEERINESNKKFNQS